MKFWKIFNLEFHYQLRQLMTWFSFAVVFAVAYLTIWGNYSDDSRAGYFLLNAPIVIAEVTVICCLFWLLVSASVAGEAACRDVQTRMFSLTYTAPASKGEYLGGRFFAAFTINLVILLAIPIGILLALYVSGIEKELLGPFRLDAYLVPYFLIVVPNVFIATALQFSMAALSRRAMLSYLVGALLFITSFLLAQLLRKEMGMPFLGKLIDPIHLNGIMAQLSVWTPLQRNSSPMPVDSLFLANRIMWLGIALAISGLAYLRFRFSAPANKRTIAFSSTAQKPMDGLAAIAWGKTAPLPTLQGNYGLHQLRRITWDAFQSLAKGWSGLMLLGGIALMAALAMPGNLKDKGVPLLANADQILHILTGAITAPGKFTIMIFLLTIFYAGELVWRERESGLSEISNAAPVSNWILFLSKFFSLGLMLVASLLFLMIAGILSQLVLEGGLRDLHLYVAVLFGFQLLEFLLFALLALVVHTLVNHKYIGHLVALTAFAYMLFAPMIGVEHKLLIFGASPPWSYTNMGDFSESIAPWLWFKGYWVAWTLLLAVAALLLSVRGREDSFFARLKAARGRFTRTNLLITGIAVGLIVSFGGFIFYNTNILNQFPSSTVQSAARAAYEQRYGKYTDLPQPSLTTVHLQAEIYPDRGAFAIQGSYVLVNKHAASINTVLLAHPEQGETQIKALSRKATRAFDRDLGVAQYRLHVPLAPGDSLRLHFSVHYQIKGFTNNGRDSLITVNFSSFRNYECLPVIGYQQYKELDEPGLRKKYGLIPRPATASLYTIKARNYAPFAEKVSYDAVIGTANNQTVVAPGTLRRSWAKGKRRYFHYATDTAIRNEYAVYSANYRLHEQQWIPRSGKGKPVSLQIYYHSGQQLNVDRIARSMKASMDYYTDQFGAYPHSQLRFIARPGYGGSNHASPATITAEEGFFVLDPARDERGFDLITAVVAHEVAHQWWGNQFKSAYMEGAGLLSESLAWYSAMGMLEAKYGAEHLQKLLGFMREAYEIPRSKAAASLLQANDQYLYYRKGPFALHALSRYIGRNTVNGVLRRLVVKHPLGKLPMATSLNLYAGLKEVTPDSLGYLVDDLFKKNTFWELSAKRATAKQNKTGAWQVSFEVKSRKVVVNQVGTEEELPMNDWIEVGIFAAPKPGEQGGKLLYLKKHFFNTASTLITVTVPEKPTLAGIDPNYLLIDWETLDNLVKTENKGGRPGL